MKTLNATASSLGSRRSLLAGMAAGAAALLGCDGSQDSGDTDHSSAERVDVPLRVVWVGQPSDVAKVERVWNSMDQLPLAITSVSLAESQQNGELSKSVGEAIDAIGRCDVVVAPLLMVADLFAEGLISEIVGSEFERGGELELLPALRVGAAGYAGKMMAVPLGCHPWALMGGEQVEGLVDLNSWNDYDELVVSQNGKAAEPTSRGHVGYSFLLRASSVAQQGWLFDRESFAPTIDRPEYVSALELMKRTVARYESDPMGPSEIGQAIASGELQLGVGTIDASRVETASLVAVTDLPKGMEAADGDDTSEGSEVSLRTRAVTPVILPPMTTLGMISKNCRQTRSAKRWLAWLNAGEGMGDVWRSSTTLGATSEVKSDDEMSSSTMDSGYQDWVQRHFARSTVRPVMQLIDGASYYQALDGAVHACLHDDADPKATLADVATQWSELTRSVGVDRQKRAWRRASGREV